MPCKVVRDMEIRPLLPFLFQTLILSLIVLKGVKSQGGQQDYDAAPASDSYSGYDNAIGGGSGSGYYGGGGEGGHGHYGGPDSHSGHAVGQDAGTSQDASHGSGDPNYPSHQGDMSGQHGGGPSDQYGGHDPAHGSGQYGGQSEPSGYHGGQGETSGNHGGQSEPAGYHGGQNEQSGYQGGQSEPAGYHGGQREPPHGPDAGHGQNYQTGPSQMYAGRNAAKQQYGGQSTPTGGPYTRDNNPAVGQYPRQPPPTGHNLQPMPSPQYASQANQPYKQYVPVGNAINPVPAQVTKDNEVVNTYVDGNSSLPIHSVLKERTHYKEHHKYHLPIGVSGVPPVLPPYAALQTDPKQEDMISDPNLPPGNRKQVNHNINLFITIKTDDSEKKTTIPGLYKFSVAQPERETPKPVETVPAKK